MKALCLRAGLVLLAFAILGLGFIVGPSSAMAAEEDLVSALDDYAAGRYEDALKKLREYVASNPEDEEIYAVLRDADEKLLIDILTQQGEHERLLKYLIEKQRPAARSKQLDPEEIQEKVDIAMGGEGLDKRRAAGMSLRAVGDVAVPYLYPYLARSDAEIVVKAYRALHLIGTAAVEPLIEVLEGENARMAGNAAAVLGHLGDERAIPALLRLKETTSDDAARIKAEKALVKLGGTGKAADQYVALGKKFYDNDPTVLPSFDTVRNVWRWQDEELQRFEVPAFLYPYQMAEQMALDALGLDPGHKGAQALLVRSLLAQKAEADVLKANGGEAPEALDGAFDVALSQGFHAAAEALKQAIQDRDWDVAKEAIGLLRAARGNQPLQGGALDAALVAPENRVKVAAAIAALLLGDKGLVNADKVAHLAARAAADKAVRQVLVIDDKEDSRSRLLMDLAHAGFVASQAATGAEGVARAKSSPTLDVVVVRADLGDPSRTIPSKRLASALDVIDELKHDARTKEMRVVVLLGDTPEAKTEALRDFFETKYSDDLAGFIPMPIDTTTAMEVVTTAAEAGDLNPDRERANKLAALACEAFAKTDFSSRAFDLSVAVESLSKAATEGPTPEVRLWAVKALGNVRAGGADALVKVLQEGEDDAIKAAAATALGNVLSMAAGTEAQIAALIEATGAEGEVGKAALQALGRVQGLTPEQRVEVFKMHRLGVAQKGGM